MRQTTSLSASDLLHEVTSDYQIVIAIQWSLQQQVVRLHENYCNGMTTGYPRNLTVLETAIVVIHFIRRISAVIVY